MKLKLQTITLILFTLVLGCSKKPDCMIADSLQELSTPESREKDLHIFLRSSGFNQKEYFYELFKGLPEFNECGKAERSYISKIHVDTSIGTPEKIIIKDDKIEILYSADKDDNDSLSEVPIIIE